MSDALTVDAPAPPATRTAHVPANNRQGRIKITPKVKAACDAMVFEGKAWDDAARSANLSTLHMRRALERAHVQRYLREQKQVFRTAASGANIHRAIEIRDQVVNQTARIQAIRWLEGQSEHEAEREAGRNVTPGVVVSVTVQGGPRSVDETIISVGPGAVPDGQSEADDA